MGLDIFFAEDIRNALLAANEASARTAAQVADLRLDAATIANLRAYREGYKAALATLALAFGLSPNIICNRGQTIQADDVVALEVIGRMAK